MTDDNYHHGNLREELLKKAIEVLSTEGIEALSLRALARDLSVSHAAPSRHFATKTDLLRAIAEEGAARLLDMAQSNVTAKTARERLLQIALAYVDWAQQNPAFHRVLRNPEVLQHGSEDFTTLLTEFAKQLRSEIVNAQMEGWMTHEATDTLMLHLTSLTAGTALVATDLSYRAPLGDALRPDTIRASLRLFLGDNS